MMKWLLTLLMIVAMSIGAQTPVSDPTRPLVYTGQRGQASPAAKQVVEKRNQLQAIITEDKKIKYAIIDSKTVNRGSLINGYRVDSISQKKVVLRRGDDVKVLRMVPSVKSINKKGNNSNG
ncbi:hypothetical protein [Pleionea sp. CnH1-48]|uniref:hypothetical protein n=1 Tax=Pleionea sp. CnH1-48 TaxID=2954494 RepID=UPI0020975131|nr:hypothetical protein [Pleionea sp. CnH1-48]MCO7226312.1 hypothetical protein [Pleionea sp. CnH1-48]